MTKQFQKNKLNQHC